MRILITGSGGFIGSRLRECLDREEHDIFEMVRFSAARRQEFYNRPNVIFADLRDREMVTHAVKQVDPEIVLHLAAVSAVSYSFINPVDVHQTNCLGTMALADAARSCRNLKLFVFASTSEVYGHGVTFPLKENSPLGATSPYAASKIAAEEYLRVLALDGFPLLIMRPFNSYGRALVGMRHYVVEKAITQALTEGHIRLHNPTPEREFIFREDHVKGYVRVVECYDMDTLRGQVINLASGVSHTILEMAEQVRLIVELKTQRQVALDFLDTPDRPSDIPKLLGDGRKAKMLLGWQPEYDLMTGLTRAIDEWTQVLSR